MTPLNTVPRIIDKWVLKSDFCWMWFGSVAANGYSKTVIEGRHVSAHRAVYSYFKGPIANGMCIDHLCGIKRCVNPEHLESVTPRTNTLRCEHAIATVNSKKIHCIRGHVLSGENLYITPNGRRQCKKCRGWKTCHKSLV